MDPLYRYFANLAPKAQLGGDWDLLVQQTNTKIVNGTSEAWAKSLLDNTISDILENPKLKEVILYKGNEAKRQSNSVYRKPRQNPNESVREVNFMKTYCIVGGNTKWGPIHCNSLFSAMYQQLLSKVKDWCNFEMVVMLQSLIKQIEIPVVSVEKILRTMMYHNADQLTGRPVNGRNIRELLRKSADLWTHKPYVKNLIEFYINKGEIAMNSYNHMRQGIHHATSSMLNFVVNTLVETLIKKYLRKWCQC